MYESFHFMRPLFFKHRASYLPGEQPFHLLPITYLPDQAVQVAWVPFRLVSCDRVFFKFKLSYLVSLGML